MRRIFLFSALVGFAGTLAGAHFYPWVDYPRFVSRTSVLENGGRLERFVIRLPVDRIDSIGGVGVGLRAVANRPPSPLPIEFAQRMLLLEHFKLRDIDGNVIGLAARHWTDTADGPFVAWMVTLPGRSSLLLVAPGEPSAAIDAALLDEGYAFGTEWSGDLVVDMVSDSSATETVASGGEFDGLGVRFTEVWTITGVSDSGELQGTIELITVSRQDR